MARKMHNGHCRACNAYFVGMSRYEYNWCVTKHLREEHNSVDDDAAIQKI